MKSAKRLLLSLALVASTSVFNLSSAKADATSVGNTTANSFQATASSSTVINSAIDAGSKLEVVGFTGNVRVIVTASAGTVQIGAGTGVSQITGYGNPTTAATSIGFTGNVTQANAALDSLKFNAPSTYGTPTLTIDVSDAGTGTVAYNSSNGHYYEYVNVPLGITWLNAYSAIVGVAVGSVNVATRQAQTASTCAKKFNGLCGYFATITDSAENEFIRSKVGTNSSWLGGSDRASEGAWRWIDPKSPEYDQQFSNVGTSVSYSLNSTYLPTTTADYVNWGTTQPDNFGPGGENSLQIISGGTGKWNDLKDTDTTVGYVIEYGGLSETPTLPNAQRVVSVAVRENQAALTFSTPTGKYLQPLTLSTGESGSGTGAVTYQLNTGGTATGCTLTDGVLSATSLGTCFVTATKAQDSNYLSATTSSIAIVFKNYLGDTPDATNNASVSANATINLNTTLGSSSKIQGIAYSGNVRASVEATGGKVKISYLTNLSLPYGFQETLTTEDTSIAFEGPIANVNAALETLTYKATSAPSSQTVVVTISPISSASTAYNTTNGHYYQYVSNTKTWDQAYNAITGDTLTSSVTVASGNSACLYMFNGLCGYFATVTSNAENSFIRSKIGSASVWLGGSDRRVEGTWEWIDPKAPEYATFPYTNWNGGEPNNSGGENALQILIGGGADGLWNDLKENSSALGFIVEYGGRAGEYETYTAATRTIEITITLAAQTALTISSVDATLGSPYTLTTSGGSGTGAITYVIANGTATGCALDGSGKLISTSSGTCLVTATKAADTNYNSISSSATTVTFWDPTVATPSAPTVTPGNGIATISWSAIANASSYTVTASPGGATCTSTGTSCEITGLLNNVIYTFTIIATNPFGSSTSSSSSLPVIPSPPISFSPSTNASTTENNPTTNQPTTPVIPGTPAIPTVGSNGQTNTPLAPVTNFTPTSSVPTNQNVQLIENGIQQQVTVKPVIPDGVVTIEGGDWNLNLSVNQGGQKVAPISTSGNISFVRGNDSSFEGGGFEPNSVFRVFIYSTPIFLGEFTTGASGEIKGQVKIPANLKLGLHTLQFHNIANENENRVISVGVEVVKKVVYKKKVVKKKAKKLTSAKKETNSTAPAQNKSKKIVRKYYQEYPFKKIYCTSATETIKVIAWHPKCPTGYKRSA